MKKTKRFLIIALSILLLSMIFYFFITERPIQTFEKNIIVEVSEKPKVVADRELYFYGLTPGSRAYKNVNITNSQKFDITAHLYVSGEAKQFIEVEPQITIPIGETAIFNVTVKIPTEPTYGNYSATLKVLIFRNKK